MTSPTVRSFAFYLPQFHPTPENDAWYGKGFTEWTNVTKARPLFEGHRQPRLPADLGFYDLRVPETRETQAALARAHGIEGFIYYHYWFHGRRMLEQPFDEVLASGRPDFPFALCWANEPWRRRWDGTGELLIDQHYSREDHARHIEWLLRAFADPRYIRVDGKPLFLVYRASLIPDVGEVMQGWRETAVRAGLPGLYLCRVESGNEELGWSPAERGFDAAVEFGVEWRHVSTLDLHAPIRKLDYRDTAYRVLRRSAAPYVRHPGVCVGFDNSARNTSGVVLHGADPVVYREWVAGTVAREVARRPEAREHLLFVVAWNEWAESSVLEPCQLHGRGFLEAHAAGLADGLAGEPSLSRLADGGCPDLSVLIFSRGGEAAWGGALERAVAVLGTGPGVDYSVLEVPDSPRAGYRPARKIGPATVHDLGRPTTGEQIWAACLGMSRGNRVVLLSDDVLLDDRAGEAMLRPSRGPLGDVQAVAFAVDEQDGPARTAEFGATRGVAWLLDVAALRSRLSSPNVGRGATVGRSRQGTGVAQDGGAAGDAEARGPNTTAARASAGEYSKGGRDSPPDATAAAASGSTGQSSGPGRPPSPDVARASVGYYVQRRPELLPLVAPAGKRILDVGCAAGAFGEGLLAEGAREVVGLEVVPEAAWRARARLSAVFLADLEEHPLLPYPDGYFDCITFADVLEHLRDPGAVLRHLRRYLADDGRIVCSIPNIRHESVLLPLLVHGTFEYADWGILDRTHLRFFTLLQLRALVEEAGYRIDDGMRASRTKPSRYVEQVAHLVDEAGGDAVRFREEATVVQYLFGASPKAPFVHDGASVETRETGNLWHGSRGRRVLLAPDFASEWQLSVEHVAEALAGLSDLTVGMALPPALLDDPPAPLVALAQRGSVDLLVIEAPPDVPGWHRLLAGATHYVHTRPEPLLADLAGRAGIAVLGARTPRGELLELVSSDCRPRPAGAATAERVGA